MSSDQKGKKRLVLHIEVPGVYCDDLPESAAIWAEGEPTPADYLAVVTEEWMREDVGITLVTLPGDKCMSDEFMVRAFDGRIVGAEVAGA